MRKSGMGSHQSAKSAKDEWLTPPEIIKALGPFDLDPCHPISPPWKIAEKFYTVDDDGLKAEWGGRVWCNPPYGNKTGLWLKKLADHGNGIALIFARTETEMFFDQVWGRADALLFLKGRLHFYHVTGERGSMNCGAPSVLIAYGQENAEILSRSGLQGAFVRLFNPQSEQRL